MKKIFKFILNFSFTYLVIKAVVKAVKALIGYFKARKERLAKEKELELAQAQMKFEKMKEEIEEGKKNDPFKKEVERLVNTAKRLTNY